MCGGGVLTPCDADLFSASKDGSLRYWDADRFDHILTLRGHLAEVWVVVPSPSGRLVASISRDRSLRLWKRTDEQARRMRSHILGGAWTRLGALDARL